MSASPAPHPAGPGANTQNGGLPAPVQRKRAPVSIFTTKKKPARKAVPGPGANNPQQAPGQPASRPTVNGVSSAISAATATKPEEENYSEFPIFVTKDALMQGRHHHVMRLQARVGDNGKPVEVNPYLEGHFTRPLRLHRRNARDKMEVAEQSDAVSGVDDKEREQYNMKRAERQAEREANQALIAPTGGEAKKAQRKKPQKKVEDVYYDENDPRQRQRAQLRYEEARPWHLEDFDNKNVWVGSYEEPLSETSVLFEIGSQGFRMVPVEKWYKFSQTNKVNVMDSEAVEKHMGRKYKPPRWFLGTQEANDEERRQQAVAKRNSQRAQMRGVEEDEAPSFMKSEEYRADVDEIDFEYNDEFQDDDEGLIFGDQQDDDAKEIERKIREEMREANLAGTGVKDEDKDWDEEEQRERREEQEEKRRTKRMRKQLIKKERKAEYDSESDHGEFSESSESEDSEEERERLEAERKQEEARKINGEKSGTSTKGTNTPTGRAEKKDPTRLGPSLKRPGSPDLSELSGNESSRKKAKGVNGRAMSPNSANGARSLSPDDARGKTSRKLTSGGYGSGSETDVSRPGRPKIRLKHSPSGSREGTPARSGGGSPERSRGQSPAIKAQSFPTLEEVRLAIPPQGIQIPDLVKEFKSRVLNRQTEFIALVKQAGRQDASSKRILRKQDDGAEKKS